MKSKHLLAGALAGTVALGPLAFAAGATPAQLSAAVKEDTSQLKADDNALARDEARLRADQATLRADTLSGRMSAMSDDGERVYRDRQAVNAQEKQILADRAKLRSDKNEWMATGMRHHDISAIKASVAATRIDLSDAIAAAERHVQGKAVSAVLENGNGQLAYKVEVLKGDRLFDVTVHSREGIIVSAAVDRAGRG